MLEIVEIYDNESDALLDGKLGNQPKVRHKNSVLSSQKLVDKPIRQTPKCGVYGRNGHNRQSYCILEETNFVS